MTLRILISLCLAAFLLTACAETPPTVGELKTLATACDKVNDGKRIAVVGYLRLPDEFTSQESVVLRLYETDEFSGTPVGVTLHFGSEANQIEMVPDEYADEDLKVHLADGQLSGYGEKVKVSGKVYYPLVDQDFECGLENPLVEKAS